MRVQRSHTSHCNGCQRRVVSSDLATNAPGPNLRLVRERGGEPTEQMIFLHSISTMLDHCTQWAGATPLLIALTKPGDDNPHCSRPLCS